MAESFKDEVLRKTTENLVASVLGGHDNGAISRLFYASKAANAGVNIIKCIANVIFK